jgi:hypothetical protein
MKFIHFHGQHGARLCRNQSIYGNVKNEPTFLIGILSPPLLYAPDVHLRSLEDIWVDELLHPGAWQQLLQMLHQEWTDFTLYNTIILAANVAFLAIPSVDPAAYGPPPPTRSVAQNASYVSTVFGTASIILALLLIRQNRSQSRESTQYAVSESC